MKIHLTFALAGIAAFTALPALANWESTRWGDPIEQVLAKAGEGTTRLTGSSQKKVLYGLTLQAKRVGKWKTMQTEQEFYFDRQGRLGMVMVFPTIWRNCRDFHRELSASLGKPSKESNAPNGPTQTYASFEWANKSKNSFILLTEIQEKFGPMSDRISACAVSYRPYAAGLPAPSK